MAAFHSLVLYVYHKVETGRGRGLVGVSCILSLLDPIEIPPPALIVKETRLHEICLTGEFRGCSDQWITFLSSKKNPIYPVFKWSQP